MSVQSPEPSSGEIGDSGATSGNTDAAVVPSVEGLAPIKYKPPEEMEYEPPDLPIPPPIKTIPSYERFDLEPGTNPKPPLPLSLPVKDKLGMTSDSSTFPQDVTPSSSSLLSFSSMLHRTRWWPIPFPICPKKHAHLADGSKADDRTEFERDGLEFSGTSVREQRLPLKTKYIRTFHVLTATKNLYFDFETRIGLLCKAFVMVLALTMIGVGIYFVVKKCVTP